MSGNDLFEALALVAVILAYPVGSVVIGFLLDRRERRGRSRQESSLFWDEVDALALRHQQKHQAVRQLRKTARQAWRERNGWPS